MISIKVASSITHQNSFQNENFFDQLVEVESDSEIIAPDYKNYIPAASLRRLSPVLRMALTAAQDCQNQISEPFDSISVGTALGCLKDTEKFLQTFITSTSDTLSPTSFIQSTHNTIGGAISLALGNRAYNMTHTQNSLSFEVALMDALFCIKEGKQNVLVGAADEAIEFLENLRPLLISDDYPLTSGASFFVLGNATSAHEICVADCKVFFNETDIDNKITLFLRENNLAVEDIDLVLTSNLELVNSFKKTCNYQNYTGLHYSSSAFAFHIGFDFLKHSDSKTVLILNHQTKNRIGLTLLRKK